jgi:hypothetical protein
MSVTAVCTGCQKAFKAPDEYAGKKVKCKNCGTPFRIPGPAAMAPASASPAPAKAAPAGASRAPAKAAPAVARTAPARKPAAPVAVDEGEYGVSDDDWSTLEAAAPAPRYVPSAGAVAAAPAYAPAAVSRATVYPSTASTVAARHGGAVPKAGMDAFMMVQLGAFGLPLLLLLLGAMIPALSTVGILLATFVAMGFILWGQIGCLICASREGCGFFYMFVPLYPVYFILTHFDECAPYIIRTIAGGALMVGAVMSILSQNPQ